MKGGFWGGGGGQDVREEHVHPVPCFCTSALQVGNGQKTVPLVRPAASPDPPTESPPPQSSTADSSSVCPTDGSSEENHLTAAQEEYRSYC